MVFHWSLNTKEETCCCSFSSEESLLNCQFTSGWLLKDEEDDVVLKWKRLCDCDLWHTKSGTIWTVYYKEKNDLGRLEKSLCVSALYIWLPIMCLVRMMTVPWGPQKVIHSHTGREENKPVPRYKDNRSLQWHPNAENQRNSYELRLFVGLQVRRWLKVSSNASSSVRL